MLYVQLTMFDLETPKLGRGDVQDMNALTLLPSLTHSITESSPILLSSDKPTPTQPAFAAFTSNI